VDEEVHGREGGPHVSQLTGEGDTVCDAQLGGQAMKALRVAILDVKYRSAHDEEAGGREYVRHAGHGPQEAILPLPGTEAAHSAHQRGIRWDSMLVEEGHAIQCQVKAIDIDPVVNDGDLAPAGEMV
jgi:hypothetical protein